MSDKKVITAPGIYDLPEDVYHADPCILPSLSVSGAKAILNKSPYHYMYEREHPVEKDCFKAGTAAHIAVLEPDRFEDMYYVTPAGFSRHHVKKWADEITAVEEAEANGKIILSHNDNELVKGLASGMDRYHDTLHAFMASPKEQSAFWQDPVFGIWCRARFDFFPTKGGFLFGDYKTYSPRGGGGLTDDALERHCYDMDYHMQAAWYLDAAKALNLCEVEPKFIFIIQEKTPPYDMVIRELSISSIVNGQVRNAKAKDIFAECLEKDFWPSYEQADRDGHIRILEMPHYAGVKEELKQEEGAYALSYKLQAPYYYEGMDHNDNSTEEKAA